MDESESITKELRFMSEDLVSISGRIGAQMVELPRDADGNPIHFGDTVFTNDDPGTSWGVRYIELRRDRGPIIGIESSGVNTYRPPSCLTHERPDSLERIADDLDAWCDRTDVDGNACGEPRKLAERIRRLAEREASNGTD